MVSVFTPIPDLGAKRQRAEVNKQQTSTAESTATERPDISQNTNFAVESWNVNWSPTRELSDWSSESHTSPLSFLMAFRQMECDCGIWGSELPFHSSRWKRLHRQTENVLLLTYAFDVFECFWSIFVSLRAYRTSLRQDSVFQTSSFNAVARKHWTAHINGIGWTIFTERWAGNYSLPSFQHLFPWVNKYELDLNAHPPSFTSTLLLVMHFIHPSISYSSCPQDLGVGWCLLELPGGEGRQFVCGNSSYVSFRGIEMQ